MADKCKRCGAPIVARFADLTGGLCTACARKATDLGETDPAKLRRIVDAGDAGQEKPAATSSGHRRNVDAHTIQPEHQAKRETVSSGHTGETATPETPGESYSEHLTFRLTPSMLQKINNAVGVKWTSVPDLIREAIRALLASEPSA